MTKANQMEEITEEDKQEQLAKEVEQLGKGLTHYTLEGNWDKVKEMYHSKPKTHTITINNCNKDTALHVAVELDEEDVVIDLVNAILEHKTGALKKKNEKGDTPLHVAASRGFARLCKCIIGENEERIELRTLKNKNGETPLFLAALNWHKQAFAYLRHTHESHPITFPELVRDDDGDTILHCAIRREHFDLAVIIVHYFGMLTTLSNRNGFTPLKVLATRPLAFRSGIKFSWWKLILYHCILVEPLDVESTMKKYLRRMNQSEPKEFLPKNYATLYETSKSVISVVGKIFLNLGNDNKFDEENPSSRRSEESFPPNYAVICQSIKSAYVYSVGVSGEVLNKVTKYKKNHQWSNQLLKALMKSPYEAFTGTGDRPADDDSKFINLQEINDAIIQQQQKQQKDKESTSPKTSPESNKEKTEKTTSHNEKESSSKKKTKGHEDDDEEEKMTPFLVAAKYGIVELVEVILSKIPSAIYNTNLKNQNVLLVAVINRQPLVIEKLRRIIWNSKPQVWENMVLATDNQDNTMLHLAASQPLGKDKPWRIAGSALQMMGEVKWFKYINDIVPEHFYFRSNRHKKTAQEIFAEKHKELIKDSSEWLKDTSESCSLVAALVAGVSFATTSSFPGGDNDNGEATLAGLPAFDMFAMSSLLALCFSVMGLIMFLAILTSRKEAKDFRRILPLKMLIGLSSLFLSIVAMFVAFCSGHYFLIEHKYKTILFPLYTATSFPVFFFAMAQFPLYVDLLIAIFKNVPRPNIKTNHF
ncbi:hypothetical protein PIB30_041876 [Stylosanthes scabra]|uniref:PGG domain-containing protein n=1 Tax=Stylosanthes scabra TaxID=79078 RepID=A0ABU6WD53_9FABA|nr:hypothetical protein [Stylosanthes scabra]